MSNPSAVKGKKREVQAAVEGRENQQHAWNRKPGAVDKEETAGKHLQRSNELWPSRKELQPAVAAIGLGTFEYCPLSGELHLSDLGRLHFSLSGDEIPDIDTLLSRIHPEDREHIALLMQDALNPEGSGELDAECRTEGLKEGGERWISIRGRLYPDKREGTVRLIGATIDITRRRRIEHELHLSMMRFHQMTDAMPQLVWTADPDGTVDYYNIRVKEFEGFEQKEDGSWHWTPVLHPDDLEPTARIWQHALKTGTTYEIEHRVRQKDGTYHWYLSRSQPVRDESGRIVKWYGTATNIDALKRAQEALRESEERFRDMADNIAQLAWMADGRGRIFWYNKRWYEYTGTSLKSMQGWGWRKVQHPEHLKRVVRKMNESFKKGNPWEDTFPLRGKDGQFRWFLSRAVPIRGEKGEVKRWFGTSTDITERIRLEEKVRHIAQHDALTDLPNRRLFLDIARVELAQARRHQTRAAVLFVDLDRFKEVNDTLGHDAGDNLLQQAAGRLKSQMRKSDTVARIGGDEFNILLADLAHAEDCADVARKIMQCFQQPFMINGHEIHVTASIGISVYPDDSEKFETLLRYADIAMYHAKEMGRNVFQFYNPEINVRSVEKITFESLLRQTIERKELTVYYQPLISIQAGRIICAEALVRWRHPQLGLLSSNVFIPAAEKTGFIISIDEWVLRTACRQFRTWLDKGYQIDCVTVNLSARAFRNPELVQKIAAILGDAELPPDSLEIEITETMAMHDIEHTGRLLRELATMGVRIAIDDFGTGYSSLSYLKRLPIQKLKIDRSFVQDITTDPDDRAIVQAVTAMGHSMKMKVVAEGVENEEQFRCVHESKCDEVQGYFYSRPLPAKEFDSLMAGCLPE